jgi:hypothetical protein
MYDLLVPLLKTAPYAALTDAEALAAVHAATVSRLRMRFGSFRTLAAVLTPEEYATAKATFTAAAAGSVLLSDMIDLLKVPGDEGGSGGGIDFGNAATQAAIAALFASNTALRDKLTALGYEAVSWESANSIHVELGNVQSARQMIAEEAA